MSIELHGPLWAWMVLIFLWIVVQPFANASITAALNDWAEYRGRRKAMR